MHKPRVNGLYQLDQFIPLLVFEPSFQMKEQKIEAFKINFITIYTGSINDLKGVESFLGQRNEPLDI